MAPQNKRAVSHTCKEPRSPAKKAKSQAVEKPADPLALQLAPILLSLASCETTAASCDTLQAALPHCLTDPKEERHSFQTKMLDLTTSALARLEEATRARLVEAEAIAEGMRAQSATAQADFESAQLVANTKQDESNAKAKDGESCGKDVAAAKDEVKAEMEKKEAFYASKATLIQDQEAFQKVLEELWQPLKASSFLPQQWSKRNKCLNELVEKIKVLALEESLVEALKETLKLKVAQRCAFAEKALACVEDAFDKHLTLLAERIAGAADEEAARDAAVAEAEAKLAVVQSKLAEQDKESMDLQNSWAELETMAGEAKKAAASLENDVQAALEEATACKDALQAAATNVTAFAALCDPPAPEPVAVAEKEAEEPQASTMEIEAEVVAAAA